jgi:hypothetical protein
MRRSIKLGFATVVAAIMLAAAVGTASAGRLETSSQPFRVVWTPLTLTAGGLTVECPITLEGSFHYRSIAKVIGSLSGLVTRAAVNSAACAGFGRAWVYNGIEETLGTRLTTSLPWHSTFEGFGGTLPNISSIRYLLTGPRFLINCVFSLSTYGGPTTNLVGIAAITAGRITGLTPEREPTIARTNGACPSPGEFSGSGAVTVLGSATAITIRLI